MLVAGTMCSTLAAAGAVLVEQIGFDRLSRHACRPHAARHPGRRRRHGLEVGVPRRDAPGRPSSPTLSAFSQLTIGLASAVLAAGIAALAEVHGTVWPPFVLLLLQRRRRRRRVAVVLRQEADRRLTRFPSGRR